MGATQAEPEVGIKTVPGLTMSVCSDGYGVGLLWCSHLRIGRREVTHWFNSPTGERREINESTVRRKVSLLGNECFEVQIRNRKGDEDDWSKPRCEYFRVAGDGTHWIRPKEGKIPDPGNPRAWEVQDSDEGVQPLVVSTDNPAGDSSLEVVDLTIGNQTTRCLRETFFEKAGGLWRYGGDAFRRQDGTTLYYRRLLAEDADEYPALVGAPEYEWQGKRFRVWESVLLVEESG